MFRLFLPLCLILATVLPAQTIPPTSSNVRAYDDPYLSIRVLPGWTAVPPTNQARRNPDDCCVLTLIHGQYVLAINPIFEHASFAGRVSEILGGRPSVNAVLGDDVEDNDSACAQWWDLPVSNAIELRNLYLDPARKSRYCQLSFPARPVWFASFFGGSGPESDFSIALTYNSADIASLPRKDSPELAQVLDQTVRMLRTLRLKPPIVITKVVPAAAPPGATVTVYGSGFALPRQRTTAFLREMSAENPLAARIALDGKSLTFVVPSSTITMGDCPPGQSYGCSIPLRPAAYHLTILEEPFYLQANPVPFSVTPSPAGPVTLRMLYPATQMRPGDFMTIRGMGFTSAGNTVHLGSVEVPDLSSPDGTELRFAVPMAGYDPFHPTPVCVSNARGRSNSLSVALR